jgi:hypothetical protein
MNFLARNRSITTSACPESFGYIYWQLDIVSAGHQELFTGDTPT